MAEHRWPGPDLPLNWMQTAGSQRNAPLSTWLHPAPGYLIANRGCVYRVLHNSRSAISGKQRRYCAADRSVKAICVQDPPGSRQPQRLKVLIRSFMTLGSSGAIRLLDVLHAGGESFGLEERVVTSTNRNFENRQGPRTRSHLASPATVAASAIAGALADVRKLPPA